MLLQKRQAIPSCINKAWEVIYLVQSSPRVPSPEYRIQSTQCTLLGMLGDPEGEQQE